MNLEENNRTGIVLILSGPSGSGKSTLYKKAFEQVSGFEFSVSCTTRTPRPGEIHGKDYYFVSKERFHELIQENAFAEYAEVHGNCYGTLKSELYRRIDRGIDVLLDIDVQGAAQIRAECVQDLKLRKACEFVFLSPPSYQELERRLRSRGTEEESVILRRLENARTEMAQWRLYDYLILNDSLEKAVQDFIAMIRTFRASSRRLLKGPVHES